MPDGPTRPLFAQGMDKNSASSDKVAYNTFEPPTRGRPDVYSRKDPSNGPDSFFIPGFGQTASHSCIIRPMGTRFTRTRRIFICFITLVSILVRRVQDNSFVYFLNYPDSIRVEIRVKEIFSR